jgi:hypothetical protein
MILRAIESDDAEVQNLAAAYKIASDTADRFRDVVSEALGLDVNPGDDLLVEQLRALHGKTGPEPMRWRNFLTGAIAHIDQIEADNRIATADDIEEVAP